MQYDYVNKQGLSTALEKIRTLCLTKAEGAAIYSALATLADAVVYPPIAISIPATGWQTGQSGEYTVYRDISADVTGNDGVDVALDVASSAKAGECGLCPVVETLGGYMRFRAISVPTTNLTGEYRILRGPQEV